MYIKVRVIAGAKKEKIQQRTPDTLTVEVKEKAQRGVATARVRHMVAEHFGVAPRAVRLIKGHTTPSKIFEIPDSLV